MVKILVTKLNGFNVLIKCILLLAEYEVYVVIIVNCSQYCVMIFTHTTLSIDHYRLLIAISFYVSNLLN